MLAAHARTLTPPPPAGKTNRRRRPAGAIRSSSTSGDDASTSTERPKNPEPERRSKSRVTLAWVSADGKRRAEVEAHAGDDLLAAATRAAEACGDEPPQAGCYSGSCGLCELTLNRKATAGGGEGGGLDGAPAVVRSCVAVVPAGYALVEVSPLPDDAIWGVDAWDT